jgi:hypothetical protein
VCESLLPRLFIPGQPEGGWFSGGFLCSVYGAFTHFANAECTRAASCEFPVPYDTLRQIRHRSSHHSGPIDTIQRESDSTDWHYGLVVDSEWVCVVSATPATPESATITLHGLCTEPWHQVGLPGVRVQSRTSLTLFVLVVGPSTKGTSRRCSTSSSPTSSDEARTVIGSRFPCRAMPHSYHLAGGITQSLRDRQVPACAPVVLRRPAPVVAP